MEGTDAIVIRASGVRRRSMELGLQWLQSGPLISKGDKAGILQISGVSLAFGFS